MADKRATPKVPLVPDDLHPTEGDREPGEDADGLLPLYLEGPAKG